MRRIKARYDRCGCGAPLPDAAFAECGRCRRRGGAMVAPAAGDGFPMSAATAALEGIFLTCPPASRRPPGQLVVESIIRGAIK